MLLLKETNPFAQGGNRLCFEHPSEPHQVVKVARPDRGPAWRRARKSYPKRLLPLSWFDDNAEEHEVMRAIDQHFDDGVYELVARCYGFVDTDMGPGLVSDLIRNENGKIAHTLKQYIWDEGYTQDCRNQVKRFVEGWSHLRVPSRDLLLHNIVAPRAADGSIMRLVVIDGLGSSNLLPFYWLSQRSQANKVQRKIDNMHKRIEQLLSQRGQSEFPGYHGQLFHEGEQTPSSSPNDQQDSS